jgi:SAM-dependent methyltransferase
MLINKLNWISSSNASPDLLKDLDSQMSRFYATLDQRQGYQELNDELHDVEDHPNNRLAGQLAEFIITSGFTKVLEVGCGSGRIYAHLKKRAFKGSYTGVEMADYVIRSNREKYPEASWETGSAYDLERYKNSFDCCFSFYVLEHLIYPEKGLISMLNTVRVGGALVLLFPDFVRIGIVPSQKIGMRYGAGAKEKLKKGRLLDAVISYWEAGMMRSKLKRINKRFGNFVINCKPYCLDKECNILLPDFDAVYLGHKKEIENWACQLGHRVIYPLGKEGLLAKNAYMAIFKNGK